MAIIPESGTFSEAIGRVRGAADRVLSNDLPGAVNEIFRGTITGKRKASRKRDTGVIIGKDESGGQLFDMSLPGGNPNLLATLFVCDKNGKQLDTDKAIIKAPAFDVNMDVQLNWHSQFESMNMDNFKPSLMAMIQSGEIGTAMAGLQAIGSQFLPPSMAGLLGNITEPLTTLASKLEGKTGITKLNSRQVFTGMPPIKITMSLVFRAFSDPVTEVMNPTNRLLSWSLPQKLAENGISGRADADSVISALFPSDAPRLIGLVHGRNRFAPLIIESCPIQLDGPMTSDGIPTYRVIQLTLSTLTALDQYDMGKSLGFREI